MEKCGFLELLRLRQRSSSRPSLRVDHNVTNNVVMSAAQESRDVQDIETAANATLNGQRMPSNELSLVSGDVTTATEEPISDQQIIHSSVYSDNVDMMTDDDQSDQELAIDEQEQLDNQSNNGCESGQDVFTAEIQAVISGADGGQSGDSTEIEDNAVEDGIRGDHNIDDQSLPGFSGHIGIGQTRSDGQGCNDSNSDDSVCTVYEEDSDDDTDDTALIRHDETKNTRFVIDPRLRIDGINKPYEVKSYSVGIPTEVLMRLGPVSDTILGYLSDGRNDEFYSGNNIIFFKRPKPKVDSESRPLPVRGRYEIHSFVALARFEHGKILRPTKGSRVGQPLRYKCEIDMILVSWNGYPNNESTWEHLANIPGQVRLKKWLNGIVFSGSGANSGIKSVDWESPLCGRVCLPRRRLLMELLDIEAKNHRFDSNEGFFIGCSRIEALLNEANFYLLLREKWPRLSDDIIVFGRLLGCGTDPKKLKKNTECRKKFCINETDIRSAVSGTKSSLLACYVFVAPRLKRNEVSNEMSHTNVLFVVRRDDYREYSTREGIPKKIRNVVTDRQVKGRVAKPIMVCYGVPGSRVGREDCYERCLCVLADVLDTFNVNDGSSVLDKMDFNERNLRLNP